MRMLSARKIMWLSIAVNLSLVIFFIYRRVTAKEFHKDMDLWNESRNDVFQALPLDSNSIVFIGTSLTEGFPLNELYPTLPVKNRGVTGNRACHILSRLKTMQGPFKKIFIEAGTNDLWYPEQEFYHDFTEVINLSRQKSKEVYIQSVLPVSDSVGKQDVVNRFNAWIRRKCDSLNIEFIDLESNLTRNGMLDKGLSYDGIHLNGRGYQRWNKLIIGNMK